MIKKKQFFSEVLEFAQLVAREHEEKELDKYTLETSALYGCIGFKETIGFLKQVARDPVLLQGNAAPRIKNRLRTLANAYVKNF